MPLYQVTKTYYVWADDRLDAEYISPSDISCCDTKLHEIKKRNEILASWQNAIPFGFRNDDKTCSELVPEEV